MRPRDLSVLLPLAFAACNFQQFDKFSEDTPSTAFVDRSYGARVALTSDASGITVLAAGGNPGEGVRFFTVGDGRSAPSTVPRSTAALCELSTDKIVGGTPCVGGTTLAAAGTLNDGGSDAAPGLDHIGCFAVGYGRVTTAATLYGPVIACADGQVFTLGGATGSQVEKSLSLLDPVALTALRIAFAALPGAGKLPSKNPPLLMGSEADGGAWFWPAATPGSAPRVVPAPSDGKTARFGASVAMARGAGTSLLLVAAPEAGRIYAYTPGATAADAPVPVACLEGDKGAGSAIGVGDLDGDGLDDVAVTDPRRVRIFLGKKRPTTLGTGDCPSTWPAEAIELTCAETAGAGVLRGAVRRVAGHRRPRRQRSGRPRRRGTERQLLRGRSGRGRVPVLAAVVDHRARRARPGIAERGRRLRRVGRDRQGRGPGHPCGGRPRQGRRLRHVVHQAPRRSGRGTLPQVNGERSEPEANAVNGAASTGGR